MNQTTAENQAIVVNQAAVENQAMEVKGAAVESQAMVVKRATVENQAMVVERAAVDSVGEELVEFHPDNLSLGLLSTVRFRHLLAQGLAR